MYLLFQMVVFQPAMLVYQTLCLGKLERPWAPQMLVKSKVEIPRDWDTIVEIDMGRW